MYEGTLRLARGHRRRDALRLRLPDGPAGAARPDRPRHGVRDPRHDVQAGPRPAARAGADPQAVRHRRPARPQVRPRLLHLRGARQPGRGRRRAHPERRRQAAAAPRHPARRRRRHRHDGQRHRRGLRQGRVRRALRRPRARTRSTASSPPSRRTSTSRSSAAGPPRSSKAEVLGRVRGTTSLDDLKDVDLVVEAIAEDLAIKTTLFENLDEICKPGAILATTTSSLPIISMARVTKRPQDVIGMHFFNPAAGHEAGRGRVHRRHRRGGHRDRPRAVRGGRQGGGAVRRPRRASSSTRCSSPTSTTR